MKSINSDDNLMSMEKFEFMDGDSALNSWSSSVNQGNHLQNPQPNYQPFLDLVDHSDSHFNFQSDFAEQSHSTNEATNENVPSVVPIDQNPIPAFEELKLTASSNQSTPQNTAD